ncbi:MAG: TlpA family protein disulfide reductase [Chloroflexi bacterium]|nr:TlpA family protein disulfide reductase [Chloroflexota bacterium]
MKAKPVSAALGLLLFAVLLMVGCAGPRTGAGAPTPSLEWDALPTTAPAQTRIVIGPQPAPSAQATATPQVSVSGKVAQKGKEAPDFTLLNLDGNAVRLSDLKGKVVLINFFASWCPPCLAELPDLIALHNDYAEDGLVILGVDQAESTSTVAAFVEEYDVPFLIVLDSSGLVSQQYNVRAIPRSLFLDTEGTIIVDHLGYMSDQDMRGYLDQVLE